MAYSADADYRVGSNANRDIGVARQTWPIVVSASDQAKYPRLLYINTAGTITGIPVDQPDDTPTTFTVDTTGWFPICFRRITACPANTIGVR